jgi:hypothetical protein
MKKKNIIIWDRVCGLVVRVPGYRSRDPGFDSHCYQIFWEVVGLERGPLSLVSTAEELLGRTSSGFGLEIRDYGRGDPLRCPRDTLYPRKLSLTSLTSGCRSVGIIHSRTKAKKFVCLLSLYVLPIFRKVMVTCPFHLIPWKQKQFVLCSNIMLWHDWLHELQEEIRLLRSCIRYWVSNRMEPICSCEVTSRSASQSIYIKM